MLHLHEILLSLYSQEKKNAAGLQVCVSYAVYTRHVAKKKKEKEKKKSHCTFLLGCKNMHRQMRHNLVPFSNEQLYYNAPVM